MKKERIIFFDGYCNLCNNSVDFIMRRDPKGVFKFSSIQGETAKAFLSASDIEDVSSLVFYDKGKVYKKSSGALKIASHLCLPWNLFSCLIILPIFIRDGVYQLIAKYRYKFFGKSDTCRLPNESEKQKFLP